MRKSIMIYELRSLLDDQEREIAKNDWSREKLVTHVFEVENVITDFLNASGADWESLPFAIELEIADLQNQMINRIMRSK